MRLDNPYTPIPLLISRGSENKKKTILPGVVERYYLARGLREVGYSRVLLLTGMLAGSQLAPDWGADWWSIGTKVELCCL